MKKWKADKYDKVPVQYEVVKETAKMITYKYPSWKDPNVFFERREMKQGAWFDTWEDAHQKIIMRINLAIEITKSTLVRQEKQLEKAMSLKKPGQEGMK